MGNISHTPKWQGGHCISGFWLGMWSTLIVMEVIPFIVLAIGVDNMFVLAHTLGRQVRSWRYNQ
jgi:hypothetical protein